MKIKFPNKTAKEIYEYYTNNKKRKLLYGTDWYKNEDFYTKEKCRKGTREVITDLTPTLGKTWDECKEIADKNNTSMLNFAELLWCMIKIPDFLKGNYSWTSSPTSDGCFVYAGDFDDDGGNVYRYRPRDSYSDVGCAFIAVALKSSTIDTLKGDEASSLGALEKRVGYLEETVERIRFWKEGSKK